MDTPRRGLVRATERAIEEYIKDGCEENLPMIRQLEDVAYQFWVESNTSFLNETVASVEEDDDGWIWDEDCLLQSFSVHVEHCLQDDNCLSVSRLDESDDTSSICSSIRPCDETDCCLGYLASCEESAHSYDQCNGCLTCVEGARNSSDTSVGELTLSTHQDHVQTVLHNGQSHICGTMLKGIGNMKDSNDMFDNVVLADKCENVKNVELDDEWIVVECTEIPPDNDWFILSTAEFKDTTDDFQSYGLTINRGRREESISELEERESDELRNGETVDLSDWAVLSVRVTERTDKSESKGVKKKFPREPVFLNHMGEYVFSDSLLQLYDQWSNGGCNMCKNDTDNYKCAIICFLMPH